MHIDFATQALWELCHDDRVAKRKIGADGTRSCTGDSMICARRRTLRSCAALAVGAMN